ncbi:SH3 domain-containing protein 21 isoform X1 [Talpa occidentalis]|uniref:SH3 domain-containing protein 21 isoform X1 n=1 Tax=Talpa occidentalis TaxID=50954 RepID=UPI00188E9475|nr:SH3 domain-containing protein 21 isoform X1 [Talpa occidentalis]
MVQSEFQLQPGAGGRAEAASWGDCRSDKGGLDNPDMPSVSSDPQRPPKLSSLTYDSPPDYLRTVSHPETCRVLFDYQPEAPDELALRKGDVVKVLRKITEDEGWWEGESQGRRGVFPDNFVLPPPPLKKLAPRKVASRKSERDLPLAAVGRTHYRQAPIKEPKLKKMVPKTTLPTAKKLVAVPTGPSKAKPSGTPSGDGQKRSSRNPGSSGSFLSGSPGHSGRKRLKTQVSRQCPASSQEEEQSSLSEAHPVNKNPTLDETPTPKKTPPSEKTSTREETLTPDQVPTPEETPTLEDKAPTPENPTPGETQTLEDETVTPEEVPTLENKVPAPEATLTLEAQAPTLERVFSVEEDPAPEIPPKDEALDPKVAPPGDEALTLEEVLTPEQVLPEKVSTQDNTRLHHFTPEEDLEKVKSLVANKTQPQEEVHIPEDPLLSMRKHSLSKRDNLPLHCECIPAHGTAQTLLEAAPWKDEAILQLEVPLKERAPPKEVSPQKITPTQKNLQPIKLTPDSQEAHPFHSLVPPNPTDSRSDREEIIMLKAEVESLKMSLEQMGVQLESKLNNIWEELKSEREKRQWLEVQLKRKSQETRTKGSIHSQTQTP